MSTTENDGTVKAVGFAFFSPEVIILFSDPKKDHLHLFPPEKSEPPLDLSDTGRRHVVLLRALDKLGKLSEYQDQIHRLLIFGVSRPDDLLDMGIPLLDAVTTDGKLEPYRRQTREALLKRIEAEAVDLPLVSAPRSRRIKQEVAVQKKPKSAVPAVTFVSQIKELRKLLGKDGPLDFVNDVGVPAVERIMDDLTREEFKSLCKKISVEGGVPEKPAHEFYRWVEGFGEGTGPELGRAVDAYLYPSSSLKGFSVDEIAKKFNVDRNDVEFVANTYKTLVDDDDDDE